MKSIPYQTLQKFLFLLIICSMAIPGRYHTFWKEGAHSIIPPYLAIPGFFDPHFYFFLVEIFILAFVGITLCYRREQSDRWLFKLLLFFFSISLISLVLSSQRDYLLQYFRLAQFSLSLLLVFAIYQMRMTPRFLNQMLWVVFFLAILESACGITQFFMQTTLGLKKLGEIKLSCPHFEVASIPISDAKQRWLEYLIAPHANRNALMRAYGTFPHPNVLGGFLLFSLLLSYPLSLSVVKKSSRLLVACGIVIQMMALILTFSRSAIFGWVLSSIVWAGFSFFYKRKQALKLGALILGSLIVCFALFFQQIEQRGGLINYNGLTRGSDSQRMEYQKMAFKMIQDHPFEGVGFNNFVLVMQDYCDKTLPHSWYHPPHNLFFLIGAETGVLGLLAFFAMLGYIFYKTLKNKDLFSCTLISVLCGFLFICLCDYYFFGFIQGRLMLFILLGLMTTQWHTQMQEKRSVAI